MGIRPRGSPHVFLFSTSSPGFYSGSSGLERVRVEWRSIRVGREGLRGSRVLLTWGSPTGHSKETRVRARDPKRFVNLRPAHPRKSTRSERRGESRLTQVRRPQSLRVLTGTYPGKSDYLSSTFDVCVFSVTRRPSRGRGPKRVPFPPAGRCFSSHFWRGEKLP